LLKEENSFALKNFEFPKNNQVVANPVKNEALSNALHFIPGQRIIVDVEVESEKKKWQKKAGKFSWVVETDVYNNTYIRCEKDDGLAYLYNNGDLHYFTNFTGSKNSALYWFFISLFKVPLGFLPNSKIDDTIPLSLMFGGVLKILQDFVAPLYLFLKVDYHLAIKQAGDILSSGDIEMNAVVSKKIAGKEIREFQTEIKISQENEFHILVDFNDAKMRLKCRNELD
jgi:hypothetical protein